MGLPSNADAGADHAWILQIRRSGGQLVRRRKKQMAWTTTAPGLSLTDAATHLPDP